jgi:hypothetical protein
MLAGDLGGGFLHPLLGRGPLAGNSRNMFIDTLYGIPDRQRTVSDNVRYAHIMNLFS